MGRERMLGPMLLMLLGMSVLIIPASSSHLGVSDWWRRLHQHPGASQKVVQLKSVLPQSHLVAGVTGRVQQQWLRRLLTLAPQPTESPRKQVSAQVV